MLWERITTLQAPNGNGQQSGLGVPVGYPLVAAAAMLGLAGLLVFLSLAEWDKQDECLDADLLDTSECDRLHGDTATLFVVAAIAIGVLVALGLVAFIVARRRSPDTDQAPTSARAASSQPEGPDAPVRVCPVCSAQARTSSDKCPHCGSSYIRARRIRARRRLSTMSSVGKAIVAVVILLVLFAAAGAAGAVMLKNDRDDEARQLAQEEGEQRELEAAKEAAEAALEAEQEDRRLRQILVQDLERTITRDAQKEAERPFSIINGPILDTQCDPDGGEIDTEATTQQFSCLAITRYTGGGARGYRYSAVVNYDNFGYRWRLGGGV